MKPIKLKVLKRIITISMFMICVITFGQNTNQKSKFIFHSFSI